VRIEETFTVGRPPEAVFDYMTDASRLAEWQTSKTFVEALTEGPPRMGSRFREGTKPPLGREFVEVTEFTAFDRPRHLHVHVVEGPFPVDGDWSLEADGSGTRVRFVAEGELSGALRLLQPVAARMMARQFAAYHRNLARNVEGLAAVNDGQ
jgi:carbon monoxide dehydrogenase subunit G